jgi:serine/threonine-protein kinase
VYAFGCVAYEMLSGRPPFRHDDVIELMRMHAEAPVPPLSSIRADLGVFDRPIARALSKSPAGRYESAVHFAGDLASAGTGWNTGHLTSRPPPLPVEKDAPLRVLVIDADPSFSKVAAQAVHLAFFQQSQDRRVQISTAKSGDDAVERAEVEPPDLVLLDYDLPGLDGAETLSRLRAVPGAERARVVVLSRRPLGEEAWRFAVLGVRHFVSKPVGFLQLVRQLSKVAERLSSGVPSTGRPPA